MTTPIITVKHNFQDNAGDLLLFQGQRDHRKNETNKNVDWKPGCPKKPNKNLGSAAKGRRDRVWQCFLRHSQEVIV